MGKWFSGLCFGALATLLGSLWATNTELGFFHYVALLVLVVLAFLPLVLERD